MAKNTQIVPIHETMETKRARILDKAPPELREVIKWIQDWIDKWTRDSVKSHWELGQRFKAIYDDENKGGRKYGLNPVRKISVYFGMDQTVIYNGLKLAQKFTQQEIDKICELRMANGQLLSYSHLLTLLMVEDRAKRQQFMEQAANENWTAKQLAIEIAPELAPKKSITDRRGRPLAVPRNFDAVVAQIESFADDFLGRAEKVWEHDHHSMGAKFIGMAMDDITHERAKRVKGVADKLAELSKRAKKLEEEALAVHKECLKKLENEPAPKVIGNDK